MKLEIKTETGSIYVLDDQASTWSRIEHPTTEGSYPLRTQTGRLLNWPTVKVGFPVELLGPPINPEASARLIITSRVVAVKEVIEQ